MGPDTDLETAAFTLNTEPISNLTDYQMMRRIWNSMDRMFRITVILRNGCRIVGEYSGLFSRLNELILWDEAERPLTVRVSDISDFDLPPNPVFSYI